MSGLTLGSGSEGWSSSEQETVLASQRAEEIRIRQEENLKYSSEGLLIEEKLKQHLHTAFVNNAALYCYS